LDNLPVKKKKKKITKLIHREGVEGGGQKYGPPGGHPL